MNIIRVKSLWPERKNFALQRTSTGNEYIFIHYLTPVEVFLDGKWVAVKKGGCILYDKYSKQQFRSPENRLIHDFIHFDGNLTSIMARYGLEFNTLYYPINSDSITAVIQSIEKETLAKYEYYHELCQLKMRELLTILARNSNIENQTLYADSETVARFTELRKKLHLNFSEDLSVEEMAEMVNLSSSRFHNLYKQIFGISPKKDYLQVKIEHAKSLLADEKYSIQKVAEMSGYNNQYHFIRQFKDVVGVTPGKYMKSIHSTKTNKLK